MIKRENSIGNLIKQKRIEKGLTLEQVAKKVGVGKSTVSKWERGAIINMKKDKIDSLSLILGIDPLTFIFGFEDENLDVEQITPRQLEYEVKELINKTTNLSGQEKNMLIQTLEFICSDKE